MIAYSESERLGCCWCSTPNAQQNFCCSPVRFWTRTLDAKRICWLCPISLSQLLNEKDCQICTCPVSCSQHTHTHSVTHHQLPLLPVVIYCWWKRGDAILVLYCQLCLYHSPVHVVSRDADVNFISTVVYRRCHIDSALIRQIRYNHHYSQVRQCIWTDICGVLLSLQALTGCDTWIVPSVAWDQIYRINVPRHDLSQVADSIPFLWLFWIRLAHRLLISLS